MKRRNQRSPLAPLMLTGHHIFRILPVADRQLDAWRAKAEQIPDPELRTQALASIDHKRFHCQGGTVFAAWYPQATDVLVRFIVSLQTISDYLDNLCDRTQSLDGTNFRTLHNSMLDATSLMPLPRRSYYAHHPQKDDGGYLESLVATCRQAIAELPGYSRVEAAVTRLVSLYIDLQVYKHIAPERRTGTLESWFDTHREQWPDAQWWEFAAATGSTLAIFALATEGARPRPVEKVDELISAYFPWICGLHILLDYLIDQEEDLLEHDLNFVSFYPSAQEVKVRLTWILREAQQRASMLQGKAFHQTVIEGLLGLYLTDAKVKSQGLSELADHLVREAGWRAQFVRACCRFWRRMQRDRR